MMGMIRDVKAMSREYMKDPHGQYFRNLDKMLKLYKTSGVPKKKVIQHLKDWIEKNE
jgi:hypothetical protein